MLEPVRRGVAAVAVAGLLSSGGAVAIVGAQALAPGGPLVQEAHAGKWATTIYNGTAVGNGDWGDTGVSTKAVIKGGKLRLSGSWNVNHMSAPAGGNTVTKHSFKIGKRCRFYRSASSKPKKAGGSTKYVFKFRGKVSKKRFKSLLKKANKNYGTGKYNPNCKTLLIKTRKGKIVKIGLMSSPRA